MSFGHFGQSLRIGDWSIMGVEDTIVGKRMKGCWGSEVLGRGRDRGGRGWGGEVMGEGRKFGEE